MLASVLALPAAASAQTASLNDITARDQLIFDQESLLNTYRCRFNIDTQVVPSGCRNGAPARTASQPAPFAGAPTAAEVAARDNLVQAQESLLNTYRCRFNIDTQVVPGGCPTLPDAGSTPTATEGECPANTSRGDLLSTDFWAGADLAQVQIKLRCGADINATDVDGWTPLHTAAAFSESPTVIQALLQAGANINATDVDGWTPLHLAAGFSESPTVIQALLQAGANINATDVDGWTPLHTAAGFSESPTVIQALLQAGANINATDVDGWTPLHTAAGFSESPTVIQALLQAGANINATDVDGWTPLHLAAGFSESPTVIQALLQAGANINATDVDGWTPLHTAAGFSESPTVIQALLQTGANINATDVDGWTPLHVARYYEKPVFIELLQQATGDSQPKLSGVAADAQWTQNTPIASLTLPLATGGDRPLTYSLTPAPPAGITFNPSTRTLTGTPTTAQRARTYTYTVTDADGDTDIVTFTITIEAGTPAANPGDCYIGLVVSQGERCTYPGTTNDFSVDSSGRGNFIFFSAGTGIDARGTTINGVRYNFAASKQSAGTWIIEAAG